MIYSHIYIEHIYTHTYIYLCVCVFHTYTSISEGLNKPLDPLKLELQVVVSH